MARLAAPLVAAVLAVVFWWAATAAWDIRPFFVPAPPDIVAAFRREPGYLLRELGSTMASTAAGFALAAAGGVLLAVVLTTSRTVERAILPLLIAVNAIPKVAVAPLLVVWLGFGPEPKIVLVVLISFFPIVLASAAGLTSTPVELTEFARSLDASFWQTFLRLRLPWALPQIFVGLKVAVSLAVIGAVVAEISNPDAGLGAVVVLSSTSADTPLAFAAIILLAALSVALFYAVTALERVLIPWARDIAG
ncbi:ABC transporter permease [Paractinoplanes lichenicola]|uniref:ABC transporter permease subunit n=1 Tax=Paractinoplanes lichenicola TaxID=2802976 RepID=A0ABS1VGE3_9ACTN|nr:ABC transporter permease subunit [Actinoplanes lichenicola]MBL7252837.1 ABC transporter permease subunit [Actinoplanes lichenicola]